MLGAARFATYLREADGDVERAVSLYRWNAQLSSALHYQLSHFEVLTRNAIDITLREWNYKVCGHREWSFEGKSAGLLYRILRRPMAQARKRAQQESRRRKVGHARRNASFTHEEMHPSRMMMWFHSSRSETGRLCLVKPCPCTMRAQKCCGVNAFTRHLRRYPLWIPPAKILGESSKE